jgi:hypothetical protein
VIFRIYGIIFVKINSWNKSTARGPGAQHRLMGSQHSDSPWTVESAISGLDLKS